MKFLLYSKPDWIGDHIYAYLENNFKNSIKVGGSLCDNISDIEETILTFRPDRIIFLITPECIGIIYNNCIDDSIQNIRIRLNNICNKHSIHCSFVDYSNYICDFEKIISTEKCEQTIISTDNLFVKKSDNLSIEDNKCLYIKIINPITGDYHPYCLISKIISHNNVRNVNTSFSYMPELISILVDMSMNCKIGTFNLTNTGTINLLQTKITYKVKNDPNLCINEAIVEEHSTNIHDNSKIKALYPYIQTSDDILNICIDNMKKICAPISYCICCKNKNLRCILDLGYQPLANEFHTIGASSNNYPLKLMNCSDCFHNQLSHIVDPEILFRNYKYVSGTSKTGHLFFKTNAELIHNFNNGIAGSVLDIACNDGTQLDYLKELGWKTYGVDPAENICPIAKEKGHNIICSFWDHSCIDKMHEMDVIIAQNVFAHTSTASDSFLINCKKLMNVNSKLYIQTSQRDMIINGEFDTIYHEHISFFNTKSMKLLVERCGLKLNRVLENDIHGRSYIFEIKLEKTDDCNITEVLKDEEILGLYSPFIYHKFNEDAKTSVANLSLVINKYRKTHKCIGFGASAKGQTVVCYGNIKLDYIIDENPLKINMFSPKLNIPIVDVEYFINDNSSEQFLIVILAWNFSKEIIEKINKIRGTKTICIIEKYFPELLITLL